jgi:hypothetical protein
VDRPGGADVIHHHADSQLPQPALELPALGRLFQVDDGCRHSGRGQLRQPGRRVVGNGWSRRPATDQHGDVRALAAGELVDLLRPFDGPGRGQPFFRQKAVDLDGH